MTRSRSAATRPRSGATTLAPAAAARSTKGAAGRADVHSGIDRRLRLREPLDDAFAARDPFERRAEPGEVIVAEDVPPDEAGRILEVCLADPLGGTLHRDLVQGGQEVGADV